jgi:cysteine-S-conjugate beta-lyase
MQAPPLEELARRRSEKWAGHAPGVLSATIAEMDFAVAPVVRDALHEAVERSDLGYAPKASPPLFEAFAGFAARRLDWSVDPDQVTLAPDVMAGLIELCRVLPGDEVALATPAYPPFLAELPQAGVRVREVGLDAGGALDLDALEASLRGGARIVVLSNPHNPTGRALPRAELAGIAERCARHGAWVLADEIHAPLVLPGAVHTPFLELGYERAIALSSASKAFNLAGLKAALIVTASEPARAAVAQLPPLADRAGLLGVVAAEAAFAGGDEWLDAVLRQLDANRALLRELLPDGIAWREPEATYLAWLDCRALQLGDDPAAAFLKRGRVALSPGLDYGRPGAGHVRLNFGTSPELVGEIVRRMAAAI